LATPVPTIRLAFVEIVNDQVPAGIEDPTNPAVLQPYPASDDELGVPVAVEPDVKGLTMNVPVVPELIETVVVVSAVAPGEELVR
jgi:hypothetical protein